MRAPLMNRAVAVTIIVSAIFAFAAPVPAVNSGAAGVMDRLDWIAVYPSNSLLGEESVLVLSSSPRLYAQVNVSITLQGGGRETHYSWSGSLVLEGLKWPYSNGSYFYILPGLPGGSSTYTYNQITYIVRVESRALLTVNESGTTLNNTIIWSWNGDSNSNPTAILYIPTGDPYTLYLSPSGWTISTGSTLKIIAAAFGLHGKPEASLYVGSGKNYAHYSMSEYPQWWNTLGGLVDNITGWLASLEENDSRLAGHLPYPEYSGGVWEAQLPVNYMGSQIYYFARITDGTGEAAYTMKGTVIATRSEGPRILMIDDDLLLYQVAVYNKEEASKLIENTPNTSLLSKTYLLGDALSASRLIEKHYYTALASKGRLVIAFPGEDALEKLGSGADLIYVSGLPPSIPGTILDWGKYSGKLNALIKEEIESGAKLIVSSTSISSIPASTNPYPNLLGGANETSLALLAGMKHLTLAYTIAGNTIITPIPGWSGTLASTGADSTIPSNIQINNTITVAGWQGIIPGCQPVLQDDSLSSPWLTLKDKGVEGLPLKDIAQLAAEVDGEIARVGESLSSSRITNGMLVAGENGGSVSATWAMRFLTNASVPVMVSRDCLSAVFLYTSINPKAVVFTFEPEADPHGGAILLSWALDRLLDSRVTEAPGRIDGILLPPNVAQRVLQISGGDYEWSEGLIPGSGITVNNSGKATIIVVPYGSLNLEGGNLEYRDPSGLVYKVREGTVRIKPASGYYLIPYALHQSHIIKEATTTTTESTTATTTATNTMGVTTTTTTPGLPGKQGSILMKIAEIIIIATILAGAAVIYYGRRTRYKYI